MQLRWTPQSSSAQLVAAGVLSAVALYKVTRYLTARRTEAEMGYPVPAMERRGVVVKDKQRLMLTKGEEAFAKASLANGGYNIVYIVAVEGPVRADAVAAAVAKATAAQPALRSKLVAHGSYATIFEATLLMEVDNSLKIPIWFTADAESTTLEEASKKIRSTLELVQFFPTTSLP